MGPRLRALELVDVRGRDDRRLGQIRLRVRSQLLPRVQGDHVKGHVVVPRGPDCWLHDAIEVRTSAIEGRGLFTRSPIPQGSVVIRLGGRLVSRAELDELIAAADADEDAPYVDCISVDDGVDLLMAPGQDVHFGNHSCDPNIWHIDAYTLEAR